MAFYTFTIAYSQGNDEKLKGSSYYLEDDWFHFEAEDSEDLVASVAASKIYRITRDDIDHVTGGTRDS